jgi:hypothetical protein
MTADDEHRRGARRGRRSRSSTSGNGYLIEQSTRAADDRLRAAGLTVALAAWMLDHDTDSYYKTSPVSFQDTYGFVSVRDLVRAGSNRSASGRSSGVG